MIPTGRGTPRTSRDGTCRGRTSTCRSRASRRDAPEVDAAPPEKGIDMKITGIETFVVSNGFTPPRPWHFCAIRTDAGLTGYSEFGSDGITRGHTVFKTNIVWPGEPARNITQGRLGPHDQVASRDIVKHAVTQIAAMREAVGPDVGICLDINVNFKPSEALRVGRALEPYDLFWLEIDNQDPHALDVVKVDVQWQGFSAAKKVADLAESYELNIAPHNYNGHLSTFQSLNLCASVSNVRIMESDPEQTPYRDELFTALPEIASGHMKIPTAPGWGTELNEKAAKKYEWMG